MDSQIVTAEELIELSTSIVAILLIMREKGINSASFISGLTCLESAVFWIVEDVPDNVPDIHNADAFQFCARCQNALILMGIDVRNCLAKDVSDNLMSQAVKIAQEKSE